jgi:hypothetical protein
MMLPSFTAEQSLYRISRHYRSSALASIVGGIRPSDGLPNGTYLQSCFQLQLRRLHFDVLLPRRVRGLPSSDFASCATLPRRHRQ